MNQNESFLPNAPTLLARWSPELLNIITNSYHLVNPTLHLDIQMETIQLQAQELPQMNH